MEEKNQIVKMPEETESVVGAVIAGFFAGVVCVLGLLKIISKD